MKRTFLLIILGSLLLTPRFSSGQGFGVSDGSRFSPVPFGRFDPFGASLRLSDDNKGKATTKRSHPTQGKKSTKPKPPSDSTEDTKEGALIPPVRTWTSDTGNYTVQARFIDLTGDQLTLKKFDGTEFTVPLARLSRSSLDLANTESNVCRIGKEYRLKISDLRTKCMSIEAQSRCIDADAGRFVADRAKSRAITDDAQSIREEIARLKEERDRKIRSLYDGIRNGDATTIDRLPSK